MHPFGRHGVDMNPIDFHRHWLHSRAGGNPHPIGHDGMCALAA
nr:tryptophan 7-halogenase [Asticcacaulis benevestitus]